MCRHPLQIFGPSANVYSAGVAAGETIVATDFRKGPERKDSGMSFSSINSPEAATPIARDFAVSQKDLRRHEKHDIPTTMNNVSSRPRPNTASSGRDTAFHHPNKENLGNMGRRLKDAMLTTFGGLKQQV